MRESMTPSASAFKPMAKVQPVDMFKFGMPDADTQATVGSPCKKFRIDRASDPTPPCPMPPSSSAPPSTPGRPGSRRRPSTPRSPWSKMRPKLISKLNDNFREQNIVQSSTIGQSVGSVHTVHPVHRKGPLECTLHGANGGPQPIGMVLPAPPLAKSLNMHQTAVNTTMSSIITDIGDPHPSSAATRNTLQPMPFGDASNDKSSATRKLELQAKCSSSSSESESKEDLTKMENIPIYLHFSGNNVVLHELIKFVAPFLFENIKFCKLQYRIS